MTGLFGFRLMFFVFTMAAFLQPQIDFLRYFLLLLQKILINGDEMNEKIFSTVEYETLLKKTGINNLKGYAYKQKEGKKEQIEGFLKQLYSAAKRLSRKREIIMVDCACGKSYVSFAANHMFTEVYGRKVKFICIDKNPELIENCKRKAEELGFDNMEFLDEDLLNAKLSCKPDIVYSLHACDMATDMTIALGMKSHAQNILTVSCCQHSVRASMRKHPLNQITRHNIYKERLADMVSDSMRALILESGGYKVNLFEFTPVTGTSKNIMLRAVRTGSINADTAASSLASYDSLKRMFNSQPNLINYLKQKE